jgi:protein-S-isoprenylcysteine O-methyltransferase Ste14
MALAFFGFALLGTHWFERGWLGMRFVASLEPIRITGLILTIAGCAFAIWARVILGSNWSGRVTVKAGHELIVKGPYALARHPIYTGMLLAMAGTALAIGQWRCILGLFVFLPALAIKMSQEEHLMMRIFPKAYPPYRHRVKALIPGLF